MTSGGALPLIERNILLFSFSPKEFPNFSCPRCHAGHFVLQFSPETYHPSFSQLEQGEEWSDLRDVSLRFRGILRCNNSKCGEQAVIHATGGVEEDYERNGPLQQYFQIRAFYPSPHIIDLPKNLSETIANELVD